MEKEMVTPEKCVEAILEDTEVKLNITMKRLRNLSKRELRSFILEKEKRYLNDKENGDFLILVLGQTIYRERFKREVILKGGSQ